MTDGNTVSGRELALLEGGVVDLLGRVVNSSNATFLVQLSRDGDSALAIYKPEAGERPLADFEPGLYRRERAAYLLSDYLGWGIVPPTVVRGDPPLGIGSLQWFIEADAGQHYFTLFADAPETHADLARIAVFDCLANNTDRKGGHVLRGPDGHIWGIDNGLCFAAGNKLRTVIWDFAGDPIPAALLADIEALLADIEEPAGGLAGLAGLLADGELAALGRRARRLLRAGVLPDDATGMRYPWPLV
ncbi:SCO1664 family protein [Arthrobacter sp. STN4]|uniref:SCO1664 family protein n=1 Tax=Arthrobacter sp. STN4 TaxID=2923276 RepID=UPI002119E9E4|nr:SCO1664 family protein [Arthrobacter sp. STN4]MCQ9162839.1 SCO1664 family protein [Arthrobacter sp. STN4]